jgi:hypothetical protein
MMLRSEVVAIGHLAMCSMDPRNRIVGRMWRGLERKASEPQKNRNRAQRATLMGMWVVRMPRETEEAKATLMGAQRGTKTLPGDALLQAIHAAFWERIWPCSTHVLKVWVKVN